MKNQLKAGVIFSYISTGITVLIQLIYLPIMIRILGQSEYGLYSVVSGVVSYLSLFSLGFSMIPSFSKKACMPPLSKTKGIGKRAMNCVADTP